MITTRYVQALIVLLALALIPTVIHPYGGIPPSDGLSTAAVPKVLAGRSTTPTDRDPQRKIRRLLIVTSATTRRALRTFKTRPADDATIGIDPAAVHQFAVPARWWSRPYDRWYATHEWAALTRDAARTAVGK
jgi:hypothetical protein